MFEKSSQVVMSSVLRYLAIGIALSGLIECSAQSESEQIHEFVAALRTSLAERTYLIPERFVLSISDTASLKDVMSKKERAGMIDYLRQNGSTKQLLMESFSGIPALMDYYKANGCACVQGASVPWHFKLIGEFDERPRQSGVYTIVLQWHCDEDCRTSPSAAPKKHMAVVAQPCIFVEGNLKVLGGISIGPTDSFY